MQNSFQPHPHPARTAYFHFFLILFKFLSFRGLPLRHGITYYNSSEKAMELHFTQLVPVGSKNVYLNLTLKFTLLYYLIQKKIAVLWVFLAAISDIRRHLLCKLQTFFPTTYVSIKMLKCVCFVGRERQSHYEVLTVEEKKGKICQRKRSFVFIFGIFTNVTSYFSPIIN